MSDDLRKILGRVPLFAACTASDLRLLARHVTLVEVAEGTEFIRKGEEADAVYVVLRGRAEVISDERRLDVIGPGDHVGELALLDPAPRDATVRALEPVVVGVLPAAPFRALVRETDGLAERLLAALARRLRAADLAR